MATDVIATGSSARLRAAVSAVSPVSRTRALTSCSMDRSIWYVCSMSRASVARRYRSLNEFMARQISLSRRASDLTWPCIVKARLSLRGVLSSSVERVKTP